MRAVLADTGPLYAAVDPRDEFHKRAAEELSAPLFDATVAVLAYRLNLQVWTYDHHFDAMRVSVWR